jgi:hypothetical protein
MKTLQFDSPLSFMALGTILILASGAAYADQTTDAPIAGTLSLKARLTSPALKRMTIRNGT